MFERMEKIFLDPPDTAFCDTLTVLVYYLTLNTRAEIPERLLYRGPIVKNK